MITVLKMYTFIHSKVLLKAMVRLSPCFVIPITRNQNEHDHDIINKRIENQIPDTGFERVKKMFRRNEFEEISIELNNVLQMSLCGTFFGACMGGFVKSKDAYLMFMNENQATIFKSTLQAKKKLQDYVTVAFAKGAYYWGWRLGIFSGMFGMIATVISVYRNDSSILEYVTAGAITGAVYKANLGPAAMLIGSGLGATLSLFGGLVILSILKLTGRNMQDIRESLYKIRQSRQEQFDEVLEKAATEKHDDLTKHHDYIVQEKGVIEVQELS